MSKGGKSPETDITELEAELKRTKENLRATIKELETTKKDLRTANEELYVLNSMHETINDGYWDWHIQDNYEFMSPRFWEMFGIDPKTKKHHPDEWQDIIFKEDLDLAIQNFNLHAESRGEHPYDQIVRYHHADGSTVWVKCRGKVVKWDDSGQPIRMIGSHTDITDLKNKERELVTLNRELTQFAFSASHDLKAPLRHITNYLGVLRKELEGLRLTDQSAQAMTFIEQGAKSMNALITDLLTFASLGKNGVTKQNVDLNETLQVAKAFISQKQDQFDLDIEDCRLPTYFGSKNLLTQLFTNLLDNALKYRKSHLAPKVSISFVENQSELLLSFRDNGLGIPAEKQKDVFKVFYRLQNKDQIEGTGIGLAICDKIAEAHRGKIWVESDGSNGSAFFVSLPK